MSSIFLSHNYRDKDFVRQLGNDLRSHGVRVWIDEAEILVGDSLLKKVELAIDEMEYLGVVLSPNSIISEWVDKEVRLALEHEIRAHKVKVLPVLLADCELPGFLRDKFYVDFRNQDNYNLALDALLRRLLNSAKSVVCDGVKQRDLFDGQEDVINFRQVKPFYYSVVKDDKTLQRALSQGDDEEVKRLTWILQNEERYDIAVSTAHKVEDLPLDVQPEKGLFPLIELMFRRPAFYSHKERDWAYALYAIVATRIVWEQQIMPRLRPTRRVEGAAVTMKLLELEDLHAKVLGVTPEELTRCIGEHLWNKKVFDHFLPRKPYNHKTLLKDENSRNLLLQDLSATLKRLGLDLPELGSVGVMGRPGGE